MCGRRQASDSAFNLRGLPFMMCAKISDFSTPSPPCPHFPATTLTELPYFVRFSRTPFLPSSADVINGSSLMVPNAKNTQEFEDLFPKTICQISTVFHRGAKINSPFLALEGFMNSIGKQALGRFSSQIISLYHSPSDREAALLQQVDRDATGEGRKEGRSLIRVFHTGADRHREEGRERWGLGGALLHRRRQSAAVHVQP